MNAGAPRAGSALLSLVEQTNDEPAVLADARRGLDRAEPRPVRRGRERDVDLVRDRLTGVALALTRDVGGEADVRAGHAPGTQGHEDRRAGPDVVRDLVRGQPVVGAAQPQAGTT